MAPSTVRTGLRPRAVHPGRSLEVGGAVLRPRRTMVRKESVVASLVTQDERRLMRLQEDRGQATEPDRLFIATQGFSAYRCISFLCWHCAFGLLP